MSEVVNRINIKEIAEALELALINAVDTSHGPLYDALVLLRDKQRHDITGLKEACRAAICALAHAVEEAE